MTDGPTDIQEFEREAHKLLRKFKVFYARVHKDSPKTFPKKQPIADWWDAFEEYGNQPMEDTEQDDIDG